MYHSEKAAAKAEEQFESVFAKGALPETIPELPYTTIDIPTELKKLSLIESKSEWTTLLVVYISFSQFYLINIIGVSSAPCPIGLSRSIPR
jgi:hypothetical protein